MTNQKYNTQKKKEGDSPHAWDRRTVVGEGINGLLEGNRELRKQAKAEAGLNHDLIEAANGMAEQFERIYDLHTQSRESAALEIAARDLLISEMTEYAGERDAAVINMGDKYIGLLLAYDLLQEMYERSQNEGIDNLALEQLRRIREVAQLTADYNRMLTKYDQPDLDKVAKELADDLVGICHKHKLLKNRYGKLENYYDKLDYSIKVLTEELQDRSAKAIENTAYANDLARARGRKLAVAEDRNSELVSQLQEVQGVIALFEECEYPVAKNLAVDLRKAYDELRVLQKRYDQLDNSIDPLAREKNELLKERAQLSLEIVRSQQNQERAAKNAKNRINELEINVNEIDAQFGRMYERAVRAEDEREKNERRYDRLNESIEDPPLPVNDTLIILANPKKQPIRSNRKSLGDIFARKMIELSK